VEDESVRTKVFDWRVPVEVGGEPRAISGTLFWTPAAGGGAPLGLIVGIAGGLIAVCVVVIVVRGRRAAQPEPEAAW
jgi:hypothetical protein